MRFLIVTSNFTLRDSLQMVVMGLTDAEIAMARDCAGARIAMLEATPDIALIDGRLPLDEVRGLVQQIGRLAPGARSAVLLDGSATADAQELTAIGAHILAVYTQPAGAFFDALAQLVRQSSQGPDAEDGAG